MSIKQSFKKFQRRCTVTWKTFFLDDHNWDSLYYPNNSGVIVNAKTAMRCSTVFSCIRVLSDTVAQLPFKLMEKDSKGNSRIASSDPLYNVLLYAPNTWQTAFDYWKWNMTCYVLRGWFISMILRATTGKVVGLIPLHPDSVTIKQKTDGTLTFSGLGIVGKDTVISIDNMPQSDAFFSYYATSDGVTPLSPISYNAETIGLAISATQHGANFLKNDATPPMYIEYPNKVDEASLKKLAQNWSKRGSGKNYGLPRVVEGGAKVHELKMSHQDAQYLETRQFQKEDICGIFGVPPHMISDTKRAKGWSTAEQQGIEFVTYSINPWIRRIEQSTRFCLIPRKEWATKEGRFITQALMRGDTKSRVQYYKDMKLIGVMNANEIRQLEDMNLRDDKSGGEYWKPLNYEIDPMGETQREEENAISE